VLAYSVTLDGYSAGPDQSLENPLGVGGVDMMGWIFPTRAFGAMHGNSATGETGVDNTMVEQSFANVGAWILGRNMFGPVRGPWPDFDWKGWWGDEPPYHCQVFVLTHHARPPLEMRGTTFHFVTGGIHEALDRARVAAAGKDIRIGGGASTVRQYLRERLIDDLHLAQRPVVLGSGESLFRDLDVKALGYRVARTVQGERATHVFIERA
jgi:dihydrofolate reductase